MAVELLKIGVKMRNGVVFTMRGCFRSVCNHPFVVVLLSVLIYMYRSSPFMFSLLVYASPVLVCTAVLLGTLLFFGQSNLPEIGTEEKTAHEPVPLKTELSNGYVFVEKNVEENEVERFSEMRSDEGEQPSVGLGSSESKVGLGSVDATVRLNKEGSVENESKIGEFMEGRRELDDDDDDKIEKQKSEWNEERLSDEDAMENNYSSIQKASDVESEYDRSEADYLESSAWKQVERHEDEDDGSDSDSGSGSDQPESSSPDASMADIIPMIDELHPLLDEEGAQPVQMSRGVSNAPSSQSSSSSSISIDSVDETDNQEDSEVADDDIDDTDDGQGDKEDLRKVAITWTEEDQKNLMDLGSSEIERNQRLENLIMRRRSRKYTSMLPEINLIDLESSDFPTMASISTARQNPFDLPHDSYGILELPPIPGSAPSVLLPRRNPFDVPFDTAEEKPNPMGDGFQEEVKAPQSRESFFRRRESFNVGPSVFGPSRQDVKWRPYFVPERMVLEESSYSAWQRQPSDSKTSSVLETESVSSVEDLQDRKLEEDDPHEVIEDVPPGDQDQVSNDESQSLDGDECLELGSVEKREIDHVDDHYEEGRIAQADTLSEAVEQIHSRGSSASSLSEVSEQQDLPMSNDTTQDESLEPDNSRQTSDLSVTRTLVDDVPHKEPVYDSSPPAVRGHDSINSNFSGVDEKSDENFRDQQTQGDKSLGKLEEEKPLPISERESPAPVEVRLGVEHLIDKDETVESPNSDSDYHETSEKIPTPTAGGSTSLFYDSTMHELDFEHLQEVQVPNTPVESFDKVRSIHNIHIPEAELRHDVSTNTEPLIIPDSIEEAVSHVDTQTILEEAAVEIKENHVGLLSESDGIGEKHAETSRSTDTVEVNSDEASEIEHEVRLEITREEIVHDEREVSDDEDVGSATSDERKEIRSKTSTSSSSSSSSDSEENMKAMFAKRRLSTPF